MAPKSTQKYRRIVTHTDFDGLVSAMLLRDILNVDNIVFAEPWMIQQKEFDVQAGDVIVDLPYDERCALWIDHHASNAETAAEVKKTRPDSIVFDDKRPSCPSLIRERWKTTSKFLDDPVMTALIAAADKIDSASFTRDEVENPDEYGQLSISLRSDDKRKDDEFRMLLINLLSFQPASKVALQPAVKVRIQEKMDDRAIWKSRVKEISKTACDGKIVIVDYTKIPDDENFGDAPPFMLGTLFPDSLFAITINKLAHDTTRYKVFVGKNIFSKAAQESGTNLGELMKARGGGGHRAAAGCNFPVAEKEAFIKRLIEDIGSSL